MPTGSAVVVLGVVVCITLIRLKGTFSSSFSSGGAAYMSGVITFGGSVFLPRLSLASAPCSCSCATGFSLAFFFARELFACEGTHFII